METKYQVLIAVAVIVGCMWYFYSYKPGGCRGRRQPRGVVIDVMSISPPIAAPMTVVPIPAAAPLATTPVPAAAIQPATVVPTTPIAVVAPPNNTIPTISGVNIPLITPAAANAKYGAPAGVVVNCIQSTPAHPGACILATAGQGQCSTQGLSGAPNCASCAPTDQSGCALMSTMYSKMYANGDLLGSYPN